MVKYNLFILILLLSIVVLVCGVSRNLPILAFDEGYSHLFGDNNLMILKDGKSVHISLDERTGAGFVSQDLYLHGFFSASIKLPADYTAGVVVAFYMSNEDMFKKNHDEIDFEFLGNIRGKEWRIQTNIYGNGSTSVGREERYGLWFDPSEDFHQYSILWTRNLIIFYIDNVPIREIKRTDTMGGDFPSKPMSLYATIWDGSAWATNGGKYKVNYKYAPYISPSSLILSSMDVQLIQLNYHLNVTLHQKLHRSLQVSPLIKGKKWRTSERSKCSIHTAMTRRDTRSLHPNVCSILRKLNNLESLTLLNLADPATINDTTGADQDGRMMYPFCKNKATSFTALSHDDHRYYFSL